jgi:hypothetical protein
LTSNKKVKEEANGPYGSIIIRITRPISLAILKNLSEGKRFEQRFNTYTGIGLLRKNYEGLPIAAANYSYYFSATNYRAITK